MGRLVALLAAVLLLPLAAAAAPPSRALVSLADAATLARNCAAGLQRVRKTIAAMQARRGAATVLAEWNRLQIAIEDGVNPVFLLASVSPDAAVRAAAQPCLVEYAALGTRLFEDERLLRRVAAAPTRNARDAKLKRDLLASFEDAGTPLAADDRARAGAIAERLEALREEFERNLADDATRVSFTAQEMDGLSQGYLQAHASSREADGHYVLTLAGRSHAPFMAQAKSGVARERYLVAKLNQGGARNLEILFEMSTLRQELARLHGLPSFAHYALRRTMARSPEAVSRFLDRVKSAVAGPETDELEELRLEKSRDLATPLAATRLEPWDVAYYQERLRRARYPLDAEKLRGYFPAQAAIEYTLRFPQALFGVKFTEVKVAAWHRDVRYFDVTDAKSGVFLAGFYLDLFARDGKSAVAAAFPIRGASKLAGRKPLAALVASVDRAGLEPDEFETLVHEFGHVLHAVLSTVDYNAHAGTSVKRDFIEAPARMFEAWARDPQALALFTQVCASCPPLAPEDIARIDGARRFGQGIRYARQWLYATFDMALALQPQPPLALWRNLEADTALGPVAQASLPSSFSHIAGEYAAGYYAYLWSDVIAADLLSPFKGHMLDPGVGLRYRDAILAPGGQEDEMELARRFLGRDPNAAAFLSEISTRP